MIDKYGNTWESYGLFHRLFHPRAVRYWIQSRGTITWTIRLHKEGGRWHWNLMYQTLAAFHNPNCFWAGDLSGSERSRDLAIDASLLELKGKDDLCIRYIGVSTGMPSFPKKEER